MDALSYIGEPVVVLTFGAICFIVAAGRGQANEQSAYIAGGLAFSAGTILKMILKRRRPHGRVIRNFGVNSYSFPSGHAFGSTIFYGLFALITVWNGSTPLSAVLAVIIACLIFLIGVSRVYKGAHFPSDVLAGWLLGSVALAVIGWLAF